MSCLWRLSLQSHDGSEKSSPKCAIFEQSSADEEARVWDSGGRGLGAHRTSATLTHRESLLPA